MTSLTALFALALWLPASEAAASPGSARDEALATLLERCFPGEFDLRSGGGPPPADGIFFGEALARPAFVHAAVGPLDVYVSAAGALREAPQARAVLASAARGLAPLAALLEREFPRAEGLLSGRRFPIVLARPGEASGGVSAFDELIALLDWCETDWTGWARDNGPVWSEEARAAPVVRTFDVLLVNLGHPESAAFGEDFLAHGLGYHALAHLVHTLLRQGSWGMVPPWVAQGLTDELDIEAWGEAWVGGDWTVTITDGWFREGWSGFVPKGMSPPPPVTGPPADLATTTRKAGDSWAHRDNSRERHWSQLADDVPHAWPPSLEFMARHESFLPRDRAYARAVFHLLLRLAPPTSPGLLERLDVAPRVHESGMFAAEPITSVFSAALGGVPGVQALAEASLAEKLESLGRPELLEVVVAHGAEEVLSLADHREQGAWLYGQLAYDARARGELFEAFLAAEQFEQLRAWELLGARLDRAAHAALAASHAYPQGDKARAKVAEAFRSALDGAP